MLFVLLKMPKWEIFDLLESRDFYTMKPPWEGVFRYAHDSKFVLRNVEHFLRTVSMRKQRCSKMPQNHLVGIHIFSGEGEILSMYCRRMLLN